MPFSGKIIYWFLADKSKRCNSSKVKRVYDINKTEATMQCVLTSIIMNTKHTGLWADDYQKSKQAGERLGFYTDSTFCRADSFWSGWVSARQAFFGFNSHWSLRPGQHTLSVSCELVPCVHSLVSKGSGYLLHRTLLHSKLSLTRGFQGF